MNVDEAPRLALIFVKARFLNLERALASRWEIKFHRLVLKFQSDPLACRWRICAVDYGGQHVGTVHDDAAGIAGGNDVPLAQARDLAAHRFDGEPEVVGDLGAGQG